MIVVAQSITTMVIRQQMKILQAVQEHNQSLINLKYENIDLEMHSLVNYFLKPAIKMATHTLNK